MAINFDFRSGAKKSGHLDYPLQSYGPKFVNICKYFDSVALAHHPMQYLGELVFFHTPLYIRGVWKNTNSPKYCIGWCARATEQSCNFFRKSYFFLQKIRKNKKNSKNSKKIKMKLVLCIV